MIWKFTLQHNNETIEVHEPVNFDSVEFSLKRDMKTHGIVFEFSTNCSFKKEARQFILDALYSENINAEIKIYIEYLNPDELVYRLFYKGLLGLRDIEINDTFATLRIENDSFLRKFNSKRDLDVALVANLYNIELHSKTIQQKAYWVYNNGFNTITRENNTTLGGKVNAYLFPLTQSTNELANTPTISEFWANNLANINPAVNGNAEVPNHYVFFEFKGSVKFKYKFVGNITLTNTNPTPSEANIILRFGTQQIFNYNTLTTLYNSGLLQNLIPNVPKIFNFKLEGEIDFNAIENDKLFLIFLTNTNGNLPDNSNIVTQFKLQETSYFEVTQLTQSQKTTHQGITIFEAFKQILENYTNNGAKFKSAFYEYGCGANRMLTNGFWLRQLNEKDFFANFKDLFESLQGIDNLAFSIYKEGNQDVIRIEPITYFYRASLIQSFQFPNDLKITLEKDLYANKITVGYDKWNNEAIGQINGLDEFNAKMQFATKVESSNYFDNEGARNEFVFTSKIIASGYLIEFVRRQIGKETTDTQYDNEVFIICLNESNTKSEKNENFEIVENIIDSETAYNLRISPKRNLLNFVPQILAQIVKGNNELKEIVFRSGEGNFKMKTKAIENNFCLTEVEIIENKNFELLKENAIFEAEIYSFSYPLSFTQYQSIFESPYGVIELVFDTMIFAGFLIELNYKTNEGIADFKLLKCLLRYTAIDSVQFQDGQLYEFQDGQVKQFQNQI